FNQYLVTAGEPLLFHTGPRQMFPLVSDAVARVTPVDQLRWISFGHVESDECGSMNDWLGAAPQSTVTQGTTGCMVSITDIADLAVATLALMHGPTFTGDCRGALLDLADDYDKRIATS